MKLNQNIQYACHYYQQVPHIHLFEGVDDNIITRKSCDRKFYVLLVSVPAQLITQQLQGVMKISLLIGLLIFYFHLTLGVKQYLSIAHRLPHKVVSIVLLKSFSTLMHIHFLSVFGQPIVGKLHPQCHFKIVSYIIHMFFCVGIFFRRRCVL